MKVIYLINSKKYDYHKKIVNDFLEVIPGDVFDMSDQVPYGTRYYEIENAEPELIITFDLAGHVLRTGSNTLSLNNIYCRCAHILFHKTDHYGSELKARQNLSMFTYISKDEDPSMVRTILDEVFNIEKLPPVDLIGEGNEVRKHNITMINTWYDEFKKDAML